MSTHADSRPPDAQAALVRARGLGCERGDRILFAGLDFEVGAGEVVELRGANGTGKTTLLRMLAGLGRADAGRIEFAGACADAEPPVHYLGHADGIKLELSALENLRTAGPLHGGPAGIGIDAALRALAIDAIAARPARSYSAGQRRRVALARLLVSRAPLWVLDEPLTALDTDGAAVVAKLVHAHTAGGGGVIASTHQPLGLPAGVARELRLGPAPG